MNLFRKKKNNHTSSKEALMKLNETMGMLDKRYEYINKRISAVTLEAKKAMKAKNKKRALGELRKRKVLQNQLDQLLNKKYTLELQVMALQSVNINKELIGAITSGRDTLKDMVDEKTVEEVLTLKDDIEDNISMVSEISESFGHIGPVFDEDELMAELDDELNNEDIEIKPVQIKIPLKKEESKILKLPSVPSSLPKVKNKPELIKQNE